MSMLFRFSCCVATKFALNQFGLLNENHSNINYQNSLSMLLANVMA